MPMNTNIKLLQSALGLLIGMWMLACGNSAFDTLKSEKPARTKTNSKKQALIPTTSQPGNEVLARKNRLAFDARKQAEWPIESYK